MTDQTTRLMKIGIYAGTFDPFTKVDYDIIKRSLKVFDAVVIALYQGAFDFPLFSIPDRKVIIEQVFQNEPKVATETFEGMLVKMFESLEWMDEAELVSVRKLYGDEYQEELFNAATLQTEKSFYETVFLPVAPKYSQVSEDYVREMLRNGVPCEHLVPDKVSEIYKWRVENPDTPLLDNDAKETESD